MALRRSLPTLLTLLCGCPQLLRPHDTESEARDALKALAQGSARAGEAELSSPQISEVTVGGGDPARVLFHVVAQGHLGPAAFGYYGSEQVALVRGPDGRLRPSDGRWFPKLEGVLAAFAALAHRDGGAPGLGAFDRVSVRIDGDTAQVTRSYSEDGEARNMPATLERSGDLWRFTSGLL